MRGVARVPERVWIGRHTLPALAVQYIHMHALVSAIVALEPALPDATETAMAEPNATDGRHALCSGAHLLHYACEDDPNVAVQERNAIRRIQERRAWLGCHGHAPGAPKIKSAIQLRTGAEMWALVTPYYPCMWSLEKQPSFAQSTDGGKWTCGLREIGRQRGCSLLLWQQERVPI